MWEVVKIKAEALVPAYFAPFGHVIKSIDERKPDIVKGNYSSYEKMARLQRGDDLSDGPAWYEANENRVPLSEGLQRSHFAFHTDAGQSFMPLNNHPTVYLVGPVGQTLAAEEVRAFYSAEGLGVCLHLGVWHTMPICTEGEDIYKTIRGDQDYHAHSVEVEFDLQQGLTIEPDMEDFAK